MIIQPLETNRKFLNSVVDPLQPQTSTGSTELGQGPPGGSQQTQQVSGPSSTPTAPSSSATTTFTPGGGSLLDRSQGSLTQGLLTPLQREAGASREEIQRLGQQFRTDAGPARSYESVGAENTLLGAIQPGSTAQQQQAAKGLVGATYTGPQELDIGATSKVASGIGGLEARSGALTSGAGLESYLPQAIPGLTPGQARFEAQRLRYDPNFQQNARQEAENIAGLNRALESESSAAQSYAGDRAKQEANIAQQSRGFLGQQQTDISKALQAQVAAKEAEEKALQDQFVAMQSSGDIAQVPEEFRGAFDTQARQNAVEAKRLHDSIMERYAQKYPELAQYGELVPIITKRGREWYGMETTNKKGEKEVQDIRKIKGLPKNVEHELVARQREMEQYFGADRGRKKDKEEAPYRDVAPLYFQGALGDRAGEALPEGQGFEAGIYQPQDFRSYFDFQPSAGISQGNLATDDQIATYNNISNILDSADQLMKEDKPFQAAKIVADVDRYLQAEEEALKARGENLDEAERAWRHRVKKTRSRYKKMVSSERGRRVGSIVGSYVGSPALGVGALGGYYLGGEAGAAIGGKLG